MNKKKSSNYKCSFGHLSVFSERISLYPFFLKLKSTKRLRPTICYSMTQHPFSFGVFGTTPLLLKNLSSHQISTAYPEFIPRNTFQLLQGSWGFPRPPSLVFLEQPQTKLKFVQLISKQLQGRERKKKKDNVIIWHRWSHHRLNYVQLCPLSIRKKNKTMYCPLLSFPKK